MKRLVPLFAAVAVIACSDNAGPGGVDDLSLSFIEQAGTAPPLLATRDSFYARVGSEREVRLFYQGAAPGDTGGEFMRFKVPSTGLYRKPDGSAFQAGDSILITVTVLDPARFVFEFAPAGLQFNPVEPAEISIHYGQCDKDFDGDGDVDAADAAIEPQLDLWYRQTAGALWFRVGSLQLEELDELEGDIRTFSQYAVAW